MSKKMGVWIDHKKAVIVSAAKDQLSAKTLESGIRPHTHYAGSQVGGGEKKYEERNDQSLDRFYDEVIGQLGQPDAIFIIGPGEAKLQLKERLAGVKALSRSHVTVETTDKLTDPQIVEKVRDHFDIARSTRGT